MTASDKALLHLPPHLREVCDLLARGRLRLRSAADIQARLNASVKTALADPDVQRRLNGMGMSLVGSTPDQMVQEIRTETAKLRQIAASIPGGVN